MIIEVDPRHQAEVIGGQVFGIVTHGFQYFGDDGLIDFREQLVDCDCTTCQELADKIDYYLE